MMPGSAPRRELSITSALLGNIALVAIVVGLLCGGLVAHLGTREIQRWEAERLTETARDIGGQLARRMEERYSDTREVRDLFENELRDAPAAAKRSVMERTLAGDRHFSWLGIVDPDGTIRIGTEGLLEGKSVAGRNWFEGAKSSPVFFGNVHPAKLLESHIRNPDGAPLYLLDISLPLRNRKGEVEAVVGSHLNWRMIEEIVRQALEIQLSTGPLAAAIISADGTILYDSAGASGKVAGVLGDLPAGNLIKADWPSDRESSFMAFALMPPVANSSGMDWRIVVRSPSSAVESGMTRLKWQVIVGSLLAGLLFVVLGRFAVRSVTRPLQLLTREITGFGETGELSGLAASDRIKEVRLLQGAFRGMAENVAIQNETLQETQQEIVRTLGRAGEFRDNETGNHVLRMSECCARLAQLAGQSPRDVNLIRLASQMHDIGKIGIPDHILLKPGRFDEDERAIMERHAEIGAQILTGLDAHLLLLAKTIAWTHHEKWDGSGYPRRLAGEEIPIEGRITAICDVFDALLSSRPYKTGWPLEKTVAFMEEQSGRHFDPALLKLFLDNLDDFIRIREAFVDEPIEERALTPC